MGDVPIEKRDDCYHPSFIFYGKGGIKVFILSKIRESIRNISLIPELLKGIDRIESTIETRKGDKGSGDLLSAIISTNSMDLDDIYSDYNDMIYNKIKMDMLQYRSDINSCVLKYDSVLYRALDDIDNDYIKLVTKITELRVLREMILEYFFGEGEIFSFYLYFVDTRIFRESIDGLIIDPNKVFLLDTDKITDEIRGQKYIIVLMTSGKLVITYPGGTIEFSLKHRKTILRVLYSVYMNKFYLYHLS